jgi:hypothetical protein
MGKKLWKHSYSLNLFHPNLVTPNVILLDILFVMDVAKVWDVIGIDEKKLDQHWMDVFGNYICDLGKHLWRRTLDP